MKSNYSIWQVDSTTREDSDDCDDHVADDSGDGGPLLSHGPPLHHHGHPQGAGELDTCRPGSSIVLRRGEIKIDST